MKDSLTIAIIAAAVVSVAFRIYKKYYGSDKVQGKGSGAKGSTFSSSGKEDDYEPYSKK